MPSQHHQQFIKFGDQSPVPLPRKKVYPYRADGSVECRRHSRKLAVDYGRPPYFADLSGKNYELPVNGSEHESLSTWSGSEDTAQIPFCLQHIHSALGYSDFRRQYQTSGRVPTSPSQEISSASHFLPITMQYQGWDMTDHRRLDMTVQNSPPYHTFPSNSDAGPDLKEYALTDDEKWDKLRQMTVLAWNIPVTRRTPTGDACYIFQLLGFHPRKGRLLGAHRQGEGKYGAPPRLDLYFDNESDADLLLSRYAEFRRQFEYPLLPGFHLKREMSLRDRFRDAQAQAVVSRKLREGRKAKRLKDGKILLWNPGFRTPIVFGSIDIFENINFDNLHLADIHQMCRTVKKTVFPPRPSHSTLYKTEQPLDNTEIPKDRNDITTETHRDLSDSNNPILPPTILTQENPTITQQENGVPIQSPEGEHERLQKLYGEPADIAIVVQYEESASSNNDSGPPSLFDGANSFSTSASEVDEKTPGPSLDTTNLDKPAESREKLYGDPAEIALIIESEEDAAAVNNINTVSTAPGINEASSFGSPLSELKRILSRMPLKKLDSDMAESEEEYELLTKLQKLYGDAADVDLVLEREKATIQTENLTGSNNNTNGQLQPVAVTPTSSTLSTVNTTPPPLPLKAGPSSDDNSNTQQEPSFKTKRRWAEDEDDETYDWAKEMLLEWKEKGDKKDVRLQRLLKRLTKGIK